MYWVIALFDEKTEKVIEEIWKELTAKDISYYEEEINDARPHITLGSYKELDKETYIQALETYYENKKKIDITFNTVGSFLNYGTLFFSPTMTKELLDFHSSHHDFFRDFNESAVPLYLPGNWIPHCTLANKLSPDKLSKGFKHCLERGDTIKGKITGIALIELVDDSKDCVEAPIVYSKTLLDWK
ncbi:2'-5' RNA ligase family protein (plasmid) [Cytobacillus spongiae]|uniref:2'-5' RNA ligase family protein n=1 Tax=Cytobacillus spongiae TaxID=2901381 RepID=UPI00145D78AD|nr:2'-5' RNA ligase family protein [Cytobacillus spongiae]NMH70001.1 2'-5' RNA ligase family protein [Bacillus sp. RO3]UII58292.1 2'-5' RNA ligase family protein [Cytobacillus spongiae]